MPKEQKYTRKTDRIYIAPFEVALHNQPEDCWVSFLGKVFNLTKLVQEFKNTDLVKPILAFAGKDVSQWFDERNGDIRYFINPVTGCRVPFCPNGPIPHVGLPTPSSDWKPVLLPWWKDDERYFVGPLTKRVRPINIINMLIGTNVTINVCCEDTITRIMERYSIFNEDASSYTWRFDNRNLDMFKTLEENGIFDERDDYTHAGLPQSLYTPAIYIYYNDDMKHYLPDSSDEGDIL
ncbi:cytochrome b5 domain-containing protein 1-like isoform X1 [Agrilus planipennis]|uniref:Cytochrome b5 domain-containing protein 1 n=1 Tax=Agrilus planipennis TaxID=224129 RepID=A0A1W4XTR4_AGRPL|nr:cytochrome b5 domain-containing protein 1-like isoform X1 [Agrilus planipennis]